MMIQFRAAAALLFLLASTCRTDPSAPNVVLSGIQVVAGGTGDTIFARPAQPLIVEAREGDGKPAMGRVVHFIVLRPNTQQPNPLLFFGQLATFNVTTAASDTTDNEGRASVLLTMGPLAGEVHLQVSAPEMGLVDTLLIAVRPGAPFRIRFSVRDSVLLLDSSYALTARVADRANNPREEIPAFTNLTSTVCDLTGSQLKGMRMGRCLIEAQFGTFLDTARASVLPSGRVLFNSGRSLRLTSTNAASGRDILPTIDGNLSPGWAPNGSAIVIYESDALSNARLSVLDTNGVRLKTIGAGTEMVMASLGRFSPDGQWIYFSGTGAAGEPILIWRMKPDGSQRSSVTTPCCHPYAPLRVDASPDGATIAFDVDNRIVLSDINSKQKTFTGVSGIAPSYSPDGQTIAFLDPHGVELKLMNADGTNVRTVTSGTFWQWHPPQWTADGQWLFVSFAKFVNVADGSILPIPGLSQYSQVSLKPPLGLP